MCVTSYVCLCVCVITGESRECYAVCVCVRVHTFSRQASGQEASVSVSGEQWLLNESGSS